jgi:AraC-like DNA-binding protein
LPDVRDSVEDSKVDNDGTWLAVSTADPRGVPADAAAMDRVSPAKELLEDVRSAMDRNPEAARKAALRLVTLLTLSAAADSAGIRGGLAAWQKRKIERYLKEHIESPLRVDELAGQIPLSTSHFCRAFKASFGTTPHMHIIRLRLDLAQRLMLTTSDPLSHIALACGLASQAHLSKLFRRWVGEPPSAWRRRNLTDTQAEARHRRAISMSSIRNLP